MSRTSYVTYDSGILLDPFRDLCPFCFDELRRGAPADGKCSHKAMLDEFPHLRFNAADRMSAEEIAASQQRFSQQRRAK